VGTQVLDDQIDAVRRRALDRMDSAATAEELEAVRIEALGRKGFLANASKDFGKLASFDDDAAVGLAIDKIEMNQNIERFTRLSGSTLSIYYALSTWIPYTIVLMRADFTIAPTGARVRAARH